ncbi:hypothetical protein OnM2_102028, partial [Erysiphe neolycopersici]
FVVLTINVGNVFAVKENSGDGQQEPPRNGISQHPTTEGPNNVRTGFSKFLPFGRQRTTTVLPDPNIDYSQYLINNYVFKSARCGFHSYSLATIVAAAKTACDLIGNPAPLITVKPNRFFPSDQREFPPGLRYYIYPLGSPYLTPSKSHYHSHRVLIDQNCKIRNVLTQTMKFGAILKWIAKWFMGGWRREIVYEPKKLPLLSLQSNLVQRLRVRNIQRKNIK